MATAIEVELNGRTGTLFLDTHADAEVYADERVFVDYRTLRRVVVSSDGRAHDESLLADLSYRFRENANRAYIRGVVEAGGGECPAFLDPVLSRHVFSIQPETPDGIQVSSSGTTSNDQRLSETSGELLGLPASARGPLLRFLRRRFGGHPAIYTHLAAGKGFPRALTLVFVDMEDVVRNTVVLTSVDDTADMPDPTSQRHFGDDALGERIAAAREEGPLGDPDLNRVRVQLDELERDEAWAAAFLLLVAQGWRVPSLPDDLNRRVKPYSEHDPRVSAMFGKLQNPELEPDAKVAEIYALRPAAGRMAWVLDVLAGSTWMYVDSERATASFFRALDEEPRLAGPFHDLGMMYVAGYRFQEAYRCFDTARFLAPDHPLMSDVDAMEAEVLDAERRILHGRMVD